MPRSSTFSSDEIRELRRLLDYVLPTAKDLEAFYVDNQQEIPQYQRLLSVDDRLGQVSLLIQLYEVNTIRKWLRAYDKKRFDKYISESTKKSNLTLSPKSASNSHKSAQKQLRVRSSIPIDLLTYIRGHETAGHLFRNFVPGTFRGREHLFKLFCDQDCLMIQTYPSLIDCSSRKVLSETFQMVLSTTDAGPKFYSYYPFGQSDYATQYLIGISFNKEAYVIQIASPRSDNKVVVHLLRPITEHRLAPGDCHG